MAKKVKSLPRFGISGYKVICDKSRSVCVVLKELLSKTFCFGYGVVLSTFRMSSCMCLQGWRHLFQIDEDFTEEHATSISIVEGIGSKVTLNGKWMWHIPRRARVHDVETQKTRDWAVLCVGAQVVQKNFSVSTIYGTTIMYFIGSLLACSLHGAEAFRRS